MRAVFLLTVQHTGTWWSIQTLRTHPEIKGFAHVRNVLRLRTGQPLIGIDSGNPNGESVPDDGVTLIHTHWFRVYERGRWQWDTISDALTVFVPTIVPLRDPLMSLLTRHNRDPWMYPHGDLLEEWIRMANCSNPFTFYRVDEFSIAEFAGAVRSTGLTTPDAWLATMDISQRPNTSGSYALKDAYRNRDANLISSTVPELWNKLRESEYLLRPFLEKRGYQNLLWWS